jgi:hypothetical protein
MCRKLQYFPLDKNNFGKNHKKTKTKTKTKSYGETL